MYNPFTKHPKSVNETYLEHMCCALKFHFTLLRLSLAVLVHSVFPFLFKTTASDGIKELNDCMEKRNNQDINTYGDDEWATPTREE